jgi:hypothetical protein
MNTMYRCALAVLTAVAVAGTPHLASAQGVRAFPANTLRGAVVFGDYPQVTLNGKATQLSPGSRVRDQANMIVMAGALTGSRMLVHYTLDLGGTQLRDVWVLRPEEAAIKPWPTTLQEAQTWTYDVAAGAWTKP